MHKKQQSAPHLHLGNTAGSIQLNHTDGTDNDGGSDNNNIQNQEELMSNFEDKLNGLIKQIDAYLDVQRD